MEMKRCIPCRISKISINENVVILRKHEETMDMKRCILNIPYRISKKKKGKKREEIMNF